MVIEPITRQAPTPQGSVIAYQGWRDVAFVHWRVPPAVVAPLLPAGLAPDVFGEHTYVGLVAFRLERLRLGRLPAIPYWGTFTEINVRLYMTDTEGRRGVVFRSLEASRLAAVVAARALFSLRYQWSRTDQRREGDTYRYDGRRHLGRGTFNLHLDAHATDTVEDDESAFLTARRGLHQQRLGRLLYVPTWHEPWVLHPASVTQFHDDLMELAGLPGIAVRPPDSVLFSPGVTAEFGRPRPVLVARRSR